jgi:hypothetical protein
LLQGFHTIVAMQRSEPHWMLSDDDAKRYGQALANALRHMPVRVAQKYVDYSTLIMVAFVMETPRIGMSWKLARQPKTPQRGPAQVFQFVQPTPGANTPSQASTTSPPSPAADGSGLPPVAEGPPDFSAFGGEGPAA